MRLLRRLPLGTLLARWRGGLVVHRGPPPGWCGSRGTDTLRVKQPACGTRSVVPQDSQAGGMWMATSSYKAGTRSRRRQTSHTPQPGGAHLRETQLPHGDSPTEKIATALAQRPSPAPAGPLNSRDRRHHCRPCCFRFAWEPLRSRREARLVTVAERRRPGQAQRGATSCRERRACGDPRPQTTTRSTSPTDRMTGFGRLAVVAGSESHGRGII